MLRYINNNKQPMDNQMSFKDNVKMNNVNGIFSIKSIDLNGNVIDEYIENNLILNTARDTMAGLVGGVTGPDGPITKFVIGTSGHTGNNPDTPVREGDERLPNGGYFDAARTNIYSEQLNTTMYMFEFDLRSPETTHADTGISGKKRIGGGAFTPDAPTNSIIRKVQDRTLVYSITIGENNANPANGVIAYTEAGLYSGNKLFAMKTFPQKLKDNAVAFIITWTINF